MVEGAFSSVVRNFFSFASKREVGEHQHLALHLDFKGNSVL